MLFLDGEPFTTGSQPYVFRPATERDSSNRIIIEVEIEGQQTHAMLDTGAPYLICEPEIANLLALDPAAALESKTLGMRTSSVTGRLHRLTLRIRAEQGEELVIDATAFVPNATIGWFPGLPSIIGLDGCLERVQFAVDTCTETFYFGKHPE